MNDTNHSRGARLAIVGLAVAACATPIVTNETPSTLPRSTESPVPPIRPSRRETEVPYPLDATVDPNGTRIDEVRAIVDGARWRMIPEGGEAYRTVVSTSPCTSTLTYELEVDFRRRRLYGGGYGRVRTLRTPRVGGYVLTLTGELPPGCPTTEARVFEVDTTADDVDADPTDGLCATAKGRCSLRAAIMQANATEGHDVIELPAGTYPLTANGVERVDVPDPTHGDLDITDGVSVQGEDEATVIIEAQDVPHRIFDVHLAVDEGFVQLSRLTLQRGAPASGPGGALFNRGQARVVRVRFQDNQLLSREDCGTDTRIRLCNQGGAIFNEGRMLVQRSTFVRNRTFSGSAGPLALGHGGAISSFGADAYLRIEASTFDHNSARFVGAVLGSEGTVEIVNSTFHEDEGEWSSEIATVGGTAEVAHATFVSADEQAPLLATGGGRILLAGSIVSKGRSSGPHCVGNIVSGGHNYLDALDRTGRRVAGSCVLAGTDVIGRFELGSLGDHGGPTPTIPIAPSRSASITELVDGALDGPSCPATDQRGVTRPRDGDGDGIAVCDPGAYEAPEAAAPSR